MNVRELPGLKAIMGFDGEYAEFKAKDSEGLSRGLINRKGEVVWNDHLWHTIFKLRGHETIFFSMKRGVEGFVYFDVAKQEYIEKPQLPERSKSKAEILVDETPYKEEVDPFDFRKCSYKPLSVLTDEYLAFAEGLYKWGIRDLAGNILVPARFASISYGGANSHFLVDEEEQYGVIDIKGNWVIPYGKFEWLWCRGDYFLARKDGKAGIIDLEGNVIIPFEYEYLHPAYNEGLDLISAKKEGEFFFINAKQKRIDLF